MARFVTTLARVCAVSLCLGAALTSAPPVLAQISDGPSVSRDQISLVRGTGELIRLANPGNRIFVADPQVADVEPVGLDAVYVYGVGAGSTSVVFVDDDGMLVAQITVSVVRDDAAADRDARRLGVGDNVDVTYLGDRPVITGSVSTPQAQQRLDALVGQLDGETGAVDLTRYTGNTQVRLQVRIVEVQTAALRRFGFNLQASNAFDLINALVSQGNAQILAEPTLVTTVGQSAKMYSGGEFGFERTDLENNNRTEPVRFGVALEFTPNLIDANTVQVELSTEISTPVTSGGGPGFDQPGRNVRQMSNTMEMRNGQSYTVGGLFQQSSARSAAEVPGLNLIPLLGELFSSNRFEATETELVVFVTPEILSSSESTSGETAPTLTQAPTDIVGFTLRPGALK